MRDSTTGITPHPVLRPFVDRYLDVAIDIPLQQWQMQRVSPPGGAVLSIRWSGMIALVDTEPPTLPPALSFTGPLTRGGITACAGQLRLLVILFTAAGAHDLFGIDMAETANRSLPADEVLGEWTPALADAVRSADSQEERYARVDEALLARLQGRSARLGYGARASALIQQRSGTGSVADIADALGISDRTLRRYFLRDVGMSAKTYARWVRFSRAHEFLSRTPSATWQSAVVQFGFVDQAHLIREYCHFAGQPPTRLQEDERLFDPAFVSTIDRLPRL